MNIPAVSSPHLTDSNPASPVLEVENLSKRFGDFTAVDNISFTVQTGEIFGFLGPNGAGKSTTIKMICTLMAPNGGKIRVAGHDVTADSDAVRSAIGIVFQDNTLDSGLTALENLQFHCMMYHIPRGERAQRMEGVLNLMELTEVQHKLVKTFSGGMRRRLEIARGLLHEPRLLILDEPTVGLDPQTRSYIWQYVRQLREKHGTTVFMTTHYMDEAEHCDRIGIIDRGEIIALDTPAALKRLVSEDQIEITLRDTERAEQVIRESFEVQIKRDGPRLLIRAHDANRFVPQLFALAARSALEIEALHVRQVSLEDVFIQLTGRKIREEEGGKDEQRLNLRRRGRM